MLFNSLHFLFFLPVVIALYYLIPQRFRWMLIFVASCYFYMALVPVYILILFFIIVVDYSVALLIESASGKKRKVLLIGSVIANLGILAFFKYFNFANENFTWLLGVMGKENPVSSLNIILPIGLSFHTFQSMAYTIEVYRGNQKAERHLGYFANYVLFFPQMVAGPIERYERLGNQLKKVKVFLYENFANGFRLMLLGFFAKMCIADNLAPFVNEVYKDPSIHSSENIAIAIVLFSFQIYADFYGYSLIAMGAAKLMGVELMENFKSPYLAKNIVEFWKRWHISLTTWFRDYLYIPLGGNKVKLARWTVNILIVFLISGLWHGPSWNFVIWGGLHGLVYLGERAFNKLFRINELNNNPILNVLRIIKTFIIVSFIWIFFRAETFEKAQVMISSLFNNAEVADELKADPKVWYLLAAFILLDVLLANKRFDVYFGNKPMVLRWSVYTILIFCVLALAGMENIPFIYFQF
ncbi:MAG: MBOAT family protein [Bacteroidota bacterium]|nr:MBOAT family protein [Bacteroidota bacterium]